MFSGMREFFLSAFHSFFEDPKSKRVVELHDWFKSYGDVKWWMTNGSIFSIGEGLLIMGLSCLVSTGLVVVLLENVNSNCQSGNNNN